MRWTRLVGAVEQAKALDPVVASATAAVRAVLPRGPVKDALHGTWLGHQLHPVLVAVPIGLWSGAVLLDLTGGPQSRRAAQRLVGAGLLTAVPTVAAGAADWSELGSANKPLRVGLVHALANKAALLLFTGSWLARRRGETARGRLLALGGAAGLGVGGYFGGHLAYAQAVGVNRNHAERRVPRDWTDAGTSADLVEGQPRIVELSGQPVVVVRLDGQLHAMGAVCSHWGGPLEEGPLVDVHGRTCLECPWHGSRFRLEDGSVARGPATVRQLAYDARTSGDRLELRVRP